MDKSLTIDPSIKMWVQYYPEDSDLFEKELVDILPRLKGYAIIPLEDFSNLCAVRGVTTIEGYASPWT